MYDINFFERRKPKPKKTNYLALLVLAIVALLLLAIVLLEFGFIKEKNRIQEDMDMVQSDLENPETISLLKNINEKQAQNIELSRVLERLNIVDGFMGAKNVVYHGLIDEISRAVPENCFINQIQVGEDSVSIVGFADSYESVAQFQHQLRKIKRLGVIFNPNISKESANYSYSIAGLVKVEVADDNQ